MYLLIVFLPIIGSIIGGFGGRALGKYGSQIITTTCVGIASLFSIIAFIEIGFGHTVVYLELFPWIDSGLLHINWGFLFDSLTVTMLVTVTAISFLVHIYSIGYMSGDPHIPRFMSYLSLFTFFMIILVSADNFIQMFVGWEGVGLCSYLLIGFWHTRVEANKAAMKAMIVNRIGDFGLILGIGGIFLLFKSVEFTTVFALVPNFIGKTFVFLNIEFDAIALICFFLFLGAMGKSAQIGLHTWLPDAMEGPTPVSALIHAATMVTAGVFMIIRSSPLFEYAPKTLMVITIIGALTAFFGATTGLVQNDLKKVIAYSTCSQLGYMIFACGLSSYSASLFHLVNHAFFKALLFLGAGCVIHAIGDEQDMRKMGGLGIALPFTYSMMLIGSLSLMGFPFLTGFYSKDLILELAYSKYSIDSTFAYWLGAISALFTAFYSFRLIFLTYIRRTNSSKHTMSNITEAPFPMAVSLLVLALGSIFIGYLIRDFMVGIGTDFWGSSIFTRNMLLLESEYIETTIKLIPVILSLVGALLAIIIYKYSFDLLYRIQLTWIGRKVYTFLSKKWYFDNIYNEYIVNNLMSFGYSVSFKIIDRGVLEIIGPRGLSRSFGRLSAILSKLQTGFVYNYAFVMMFGLFLFVTILIFI